MPDDNDTDNMIEAKRFVDALHKAPELHDVVVRLCKEFNWPLIDVLGGLAVFFEVQERIEKKRLIAERLR